MLSMSHEILLPLKFIEIDEVSVKLLHKTINQITTNFKNFMKHLHLMFQFMLS